MATEQTLNTLIINYLTQAQFDAAVSGGTIEANQIYLTPDASITGVTAGTGLSGGGSSGSLTINHSNSVTAKSTVALYPISFDAQGHITGNNNAVTTLKNPNVIRLNLFNETSARAVANQNTPTSYIDYDGGTANQSFSAAGKNAITSIGISGDTLSWVRADGSSGSSTVTITASVASGATVLTDTDGNVITTTGNTTPVWFEGGVPKDVTGIAFSLLPTGTGASNVAVGNHSHGNITNGGDITTTATIASGDRLVINDESESKINNSSITFGTSTTTFLTNKGTWETPAGTTYTFDGTYNASTNKAATVATVTNAINALDGGTIGTGATNKTITSLSQSNGQVSATFSNISITASQISDFTSAVSGATAQPASHTHGNISNDGKITSTIVTVANNDALLFADSSNSGKIERLAVFDGSTTTQALSKKGTWETFSKFSGSYTDLTNKPTIPTLPSNIVNTITTNAGRHTTISSQKGDVSFNVPTHTSHLTNDSGFATSESLATDYVTIGTVQTITADQKTFNGAIRWGTSSKYGAVNYNSTIDALVFSFA